MNKRLIIAMALWLIVFMVWMGYYGSQQADVEPETVETVETDDIPVAVTDAPERTEGVEHRGIVEARSDEDEAESRAALVTTEKFTIGLSSIDGIVDTWKLNEYEHGEEKINFIQKNLKYLGNFRIVFQGFEKAAQQPELQFAHEEKDPFTHIFTAAVPDAQGIFLEKVYTFHPEEYFFDLRVRLRNTTDVPWQNVYRDTYGLVWGSPVFWSDDDSRYEELNLLSYTMQGDLEKIKPEQKRTSAFYWLGIEDRYFLMSVMPVTADGKLRTDNRINSADIRIEGDLPDKTAQFSLNRSEAIVAANGELVDHYRVFLGPKRYNLLSSDSLAPYNLDSVISGYFLTPRFLVVGVERLMYAIYSVINNFGIAIIFLTLVVKIILHPLTHKSFISMRKMQLLQPKLAALKEQYKNDPKAMQQRTMELYKKEKVNPIGGCLPMLLQFPIFIALYQLLPRLVDLKNVSFLWIKDLSSPDVVFALPFFENVPILPSTFNLLPLIMTGVSILQSKIQSKGHAAGAEVTQQQQSQRKMMMFLPLIFLFIFYSMPSGLVLYWTVQNIFSIIEQMLINKKYTSLGSMEAQKA